MGIIRYRRPILGSMATFAFFEAVEVVKHVNFLIDGGAPLKPVLLLLGRSEGGVTTGAGNAFCGIRASFEQGGFVSGDAAGAGNEGFVLMDRSVEIGGSVNVAARIVDDLVVCRVTRREDV